MANDKNDPKDRMSPEEKLFRVIAQGDNELPDDPSQDDLLETDFFARFETAVLKWRSQIARLFSHLFRGARLPLSDIFRSSSSIKNASYAPSLTVPLKSVNQSLMIAVGLLFFYLIFDFTFGRLHQRLTIEGEAAPIVRFALPDTARKTSDLNRYVDQANRRNVFLLPKAPPVSAVSQSPEEPASEQAPLLPNLKLVGISWDADGYIAMVETDAAKGASFVRVGDFLGEDVKIVKITEESITVQIDEKTTELTYAVNAPAQTQTIDQRP